MNVAILTSPNQWFEHYATLLSETLGNVPIYLDHNKIDKPFDTIFILSYHRIIEPDYLKKHKHNIVIHESNLPAGKGWAPLLWQVLEGKNEIIFTMFEAGEGLDNGDVYMKKTLYLTGTELNGELRKKQAELTMQMCQAFVEQYETYKAPLPQSGNESFYPKRTPKDSELDINKTIHDQFNLLRIVDNDNYPAFFELEGQRYRLTVELDSVKGGQLIDFVDLTNDEMLDVLEMRNNPEVRKWMYTQDEISQEQHFSFIRKLTDDTENQYFMVKQQKAILGVIYFNNINFEKQTAVFGLYANLFYSKLGVGKLLIEFVQFYTKMILRIKRLKLEVIAENVRAVNLYSKYGFIESGRFQKNGFEVLSMEKEL